MQRTEKPTAITVRNIPSDVAEAIRERADRDGTSFNKTVIRLLEESLDAKHGRRTNGLERFAGGWTAAEADEFDRRLKGIRKIDLA